MKPIVDGGHITKSSIKKIYIQNFTQLVKISFTQIVCFYQLYMNLPNNCFLIYVDLTLAKHQTRIPQMTKKKSNKINVGNFDMTSVGRNLFLINLKL